MESFAVNEVISLGTKSGKLVADHIPPSKFTLAADPLEVADRLGFGNQARFVRK